MQRGRLLPERIRAGSVDGRSVFFIDCFSKILTNLCNVNETITGKTTPDCDSPRNMRPRILPGGVRCVIRAFALLTALSLEHVRGEGGEKGGHVKDFSEDGSGVRPGMLILLPDAATAAEGFSRFLKQRTESDEWTVSIRQVFHITLPETTSNGMQIVFLL